jgi:beta-lactamase regulating signal transducer with metallopeptidase domain
MAWWIFQNLVVTAALAGVVAAICRFGRIGPVGRHALWVLVLVKFVTPPLLAWPWAAPDPLGVSRLDAWAGARESGPGPTRAADSVEPSASDDVRPRDAAPDGRSASPASRDDAAGSLAAAAWPWLLGLWAAGSVALLALEALRLARLARRIRSATPADPAIVGRVAELSERFGLRPIPVLSLPGSPSPVVWCLGRPRLLWPAELRIDSPPSEIGACIDGLLVHELAHITRRDHLVSWIELAAGVAWWWNPLFWSVRSARREQAELACDAWVISALPNGRRAYAESLLALSSLGRASSSSMAAVVGVRASSRRVLERRLVMIMKGRAPLRLPSAGLLALVVMAAATLPAWAVSPEEQPPPRTSQEQQPTVKPKPEPVSKPVQTKPAPVKTPAQPRVVTVRPAEVPIVQKQPAVVTTTEIPKEVEILRSKVKQAWPTQLTDEGQKLVKTFEADRDAIRADADAKVQARRDALVKELQALQDQYAKAGQLDEAVAIRDFLRAGGPDEGFLRLRIKR